MAARRVCAERLTLVHVRRSIRLVARWRTLQGAWGSWLRRIVGAHAPGLRATGHEDGTTFVFELCCVSFVSFKKRRDGRVAVVEGVKSGKASPGCGCRTALTAAGGGGRSRGKAHGRQPLRSDRRRWDVPGAAVTAADIRRDQQLDRPRSRSTPRLRECGVTVSVSSSPPDGVEDLAQPGPAIAARSASGWGGVLTGQRRAYAFTARLILADYEARSNASEPGWEDQRRCRGWETLPCARSGGPGA